MHLTINGEAREVPRVMTITELLAHLELSGLVAVEVNREIVPRATHAGRTLADGDVLEIVQMVGGG